MEKVSSENLRSRKLGSSGIVIHPVGLGAMPMSITGRPEEKQSIGVICAALDAGIDFIDTADCYCLDENDLGHNERLVAKALREWKGGHEVVVATKGGVRRPQGDWVHDGRPERLKEACEASLRALQTDCIRLYQLHAPDQNVPIEDSVGALSRLKQEGKIEHIGLSNVNVEQIKKAQKIAVVVSVQNQANPYHMQGLQDGVLSYCQELGMAFIAYSPLGGWQAGRIAHEPVLREMSARLGPTPFQVVIAWLLYKSPCLIPIPGASKVQNAIDSANAAQLILSEADVGLLGRSFGVLQGD